MVTALFNLSRCLRGKPRTLSAHRFLPPQETAMATVTAEPNLSAPATPAPESSLGTVTRPADQIEDPYIWKPAGAFGLQAVQAKAPPPLLPVAQPESPPMAKANEAYEALWRWRDFAAGVAVGAVSIIAFSLAYRLERR
jgi:hypothetical protein